jgi:hypothetical protein
MDSRDDSSQRETRPVPPVNETIPSLPLDDCLPPALPATPVAAPREGARRPRRSLNPMTRMRREVMDELAERRAKGSLHYVDGVDAALADRTAFADPGGTALIVSGIARRILERRRLIARMHAGEGVPRQMVEELDHLEGLFDGYNEIGAALSEFLGCPEVWDKARSQGFGLISSGEVTMLPWMRQEAPDAGDMGFPF